MKDRVTKKDVSEFLNLVKKFGYWSNEVKEYFSNFTYHAVQRLEVKGQMKLNRINPAYRLR